MRRIAVILSAAAVLALGLATPASAAVLPTYCHLGAGKIAVSTSTATRSLDIRWPGLSCTAPATGTGVSVLLYAWNGSSWYFVNNAYNVSTTSLSQPAGAVVDSCPHRALVKARVTYIVTSSTTQTKTPYWTNTTICS